MSWARDIFPDGPCDGCGSLVSVESFDHSEPEKKSEMLCCSCWKKEAETEGGHRSEAH